MAQRPLPFWAVALVSAALVGGVAGEAKPQGVPTLSQILVGSRNPQAGGSEVFVLGHNLTGTASCSEAECRKRVQVRPWDPRSALAPHAYCLRSPCATARALSPSSASRSLSPYRPFSRSAYRSVCLPSSVNTLPYPRRPTPVYLPPPLFLSPCPSTAPSTQSSAPSSPSAPSVLTLPPRTPPSTPH
jgi:hypothetical protein